MRAGPWGAAIMVANYLAVVSAGAGGTIGVQSNPICSCWWLGGGLRQRSDGIWNGDHRDGSMALRDLTHGRSVPCDHLCSRITASDPTHNLAFVRMVACTAIHHSWSSRDPNRHPVVGPDRSAHIQNWRGHIPCRVSDLCLCPKIEHRQPLG